MPHIPYADPASITDREILDYLELARKEGTPRPESQAIRVNNPNIIRALSQAWELTYREGVCDHALKELCRVYVSKSSAHLACSTAPLSLIHPIQYALTEFIFSKQQI